MIGDKLMDLGTIFAILLVSMLVFLPFVLIFHPRVKDKLRGNDKVDASDDKKNENK